MLDIGDKFDSDLLGTGVVVGMMSNDFGFTNYQVRLDKWSEAYIEHLGGIDKAYILVSEDQIRYKKKGD